jgi:hypothetical protein
MNKIVFAIHIIVGVVLLAEGVWGALVVWDAVSLMVAIYAPILAIFGWHISSSTPSRLKKLYMFHLLTLIAINIIWPWQIVATADRMKVDPNAGGWLPDPHILLYWELTLLLTMAAVSILVLGYIVFSKNNEQLNKPDLAMPFSIFRVGFFVITALTGGITVGSYLWFKRFLSTLVF